MELGPAVQVAAFVLFAAIAVGGALGMTTTMSMFRSAIFLMASFIGVAGLFILLMADLLGLLQVMMYIGGMLVMALFMVLFSGDPGGAMMTGMMELPLVEQLFSLGLKRDGGGRDGHKDHGSGHEDGDGRGEAEDDEHSHAGREGETHGSHSATRHHGDGNREGTSEADEDAEGGGHEHGNGHEMEPMFNVGMKRPAAILAAAVGLLLTGMIVLRPAWPVRDALPDQRSAERVGDLLMGKYMIAFEGAGLMILLGIFGAVYLARPGRYPDPPDRARIRAAVDEPPAPIDGGEGAGETR